MFQYDNAQILKLEQPTLQKKKMKPADNQYELNLKLMLYILTATFPEVKCANDCLTFVS